MKPRGTPKKQQTNPDVEAGETVSMTPPRRTSPQEEVSPAGTFDTALTSTSYDSEQRSPPPQKIAIDVKSSPSQSRSAGMMLGMTKPALGLASLLVLGLGGAAAFGWFQIPGLNEQIKELEAQVDRLSDQVDRLSDENDRYEDLNDQLNGTVGELRDLTEDLSASVTHLEEVKNQLNNTNLELMVRVDELAVENQNYASLNRELNATASQLAQEVDFFEAALSELVLENSVLSNLTDVLQGMTLQLGNLTTEQNATLAQMHGVLTDLHAENNRLEELNTNLGAIVSFLNTTSSGLDTSLQQITGFLADQIVANQVSIAENHKSLYRQNVANWDCGYRDIFRDDGFGTDWDLAITDLPRVLEHVDDRVLSELCLDVADFQLFLLREYPDEVTTHELMTVVQLYTDEALTYYYPGPGEDGVTAEEWADAGYRCFNLDNQFAMFAAH